MPSGYATPAQALSDFASWRLPRLPQLCQSKANEDHELMKDAENLSHIKLDITNVKSLAVKNPIVSLSKTSR
ncbi:hypothetical protein BVRB_8g185290 [Beta vulgaris subsp. vulgaris]|nr:hypothetical protein BVRB_8g185290 [Beta vulgaris subsp. vulgaris]